MPSTLAVDASYQTAYDADLQAAHAKGRGAAEAKQEVSAPAASWSNCRLRQLLQQTLPAGYLLLPSIPFMIL